MPPKPKLFDMTQLRLGVIDAASRTMGTSANSGSSSSILALSQMKPLFIISSEKIASCTPTAPSEWPVSDLVAEICGIVLAEHLADGLDLALVADRACRCRAG